MWYIITTFVATQFDIYHHPMAKLAENFQPLGMPGSCLISKSAKQASLHTGFQNRKIAAYEAKRGSLL